MTEQVMGVVSAEVDPVNRRIVHTGILGAETSGASPEGHRIRWRMQNIIGQAHFIEEPRTLTERLNEAYDEEAEREDEEFFRNTKAYYRRRRSAED